MNIRDLLTNAWESIVANKLRALLTTLGIVIGISAVIAMLSIGQGAQSVIISQVQGLGANTISILPIANFTGAPNRAQLTALVSNKLDKRILDKLNNSVRFPEIAELSAETSGSYEVNYRAQSSLVSVVGVTADYFNVREVSVTKGRTITGDDDRKLRKVAVIGPRVAETLYGLNEPVGTKLKIKDTNYLVIGVAADKSTAIDNQVFIPLQTATNVLIGTSGYSQIIAKVNSADEIDQAAAKIETALRDFYHIKEGKKSTFSVITSKDVQTLAETVTSIFTTLLASVASISLVVGGIGIMNIMLVSVTERTKEIGLRKAVGAKQKDILGQFLMEAILLTQFGGILGTILGITLGIIVGKVGGFDVSISAQPVILATSVSIAIGLIFGFYPAYRAARLNPIDALRYE